MTLSGRIKATYSGTAATATAVPVYFETAAGALTIGATDQLVIDNILASTSANADVVVFWDTDGAGFAEHKVLCRCSISGSRVVALAQVQVVPRGNSLWCTVSTGNVLITAWGRIN